ncbi:MAG: ATP-binding protein [bacterium]|nr:ATP-binding protein [bacterium]
MSEQAGPQAEVLVLQQERDSLLAELQKAYLEMEEHLLSSGREQKIAYQVLRDRNEELQERLDELEKAHQDLKEAQRMLIRSERLAAMGEMAAAIVHEIKNPLAVIIGRASWLLSDDQAPAQRSLEFILKAGQHLKSLVEDVLNFARHHRGKAQNLDLNEVISELKAFLTPVTRMARLELELAPDLPWVLCDPGQVEQVLTNLVLNALDATEKKGHIRLISSRGSIQKSLDAETEAKCPYVLASEMAEEVLAADFACLEVRDNGPGIPEETLSHIFEAFYTTKGESEGTGLGLSIARTIVGEWGGNILVASRAGEGTSFRVYLPVDREERAAGSEDAG